MKLTANIIGATGLVGSQLLNFLIEDDRFSQINVFTRRSTGLANSKIKEYLVDFNNIDNWGKFVQGDVLFSCMGTTLKTAGSMENQYRIDYTYQFEVAEYAAKNGVVDYVLISSVGANAKSKVFYSRMKGELEHAVEKLGFRKTIILRPSILDGNRKEKRTAEVISIKVGRWLTKFIFKKYRPIKDKIVALAMINAVFIETPKAVYELDEIFELAGY